MKSSAAPAITFRKIDALGGMVAAIERGYPQREIAEASYHTSWPWTARRKSSSA